MHRHLDIPRPPIRRRPRIWAPIPMTLLTNWPPRPAQKMGRRIILKIRTLTKGYPSGRPSSYTVYGPHYLGNYAAAAWVLRSKLISQINSLTTRNPGRNWDHNSTLVSSFRSLKDLSRTRTLSLRTSIYNHHHGWSMAIRRRLVLKIRLTRMVGINGVSKVPCMWKGEMSLICRTIHRPLLKPEEVKKVLVNGQDLLNRRH